MCRNLYQMLLFSIWILKTLSSISLKLMILKLAFLTFSTVKSCISWSKVVKVSFQTLLFCLFVQIYLMETVEEDSLESAVSDQNTVSYKCIFNKKRISFLSLSEHFIQIIDIILYLTLQYPWYVFLHVSNVF